MPPPLVLCAPRMLAALVLAHGLAGCSARPLPLSVQAGASVAIALAGEASLGEAVGYGGDLLTTLGRHDDQRGSLVFVLRPVSGGAEREVSPRLVTRTLPDPASEVALRNAVSAQMPGMGIAQVLAVVDVPADVPAGEYDVSLRRRRRTDAGGVEELPAPVYGQRLTVLPALVGASAGAPTPSTTHAGLYASDVSLQLADLVPLPKVVLALPSAPRPHAARVVLSYPAARIRPRGVFEEQHFGRGSIVAWRDDAAAGRVTIDFMDPQAEVRALALVFEPRQPLSAGRVSVSEISVVSAILYDRDGTVRGGTVTPLLIR